MEEGPFGVAIIQVPYMQRGRAP
ncbi:uncharacterized protein G2W53_025248 [Senna tora]|uniref:Uncharacterized protein n=1 Tax=Senna tora TaxID=362788 RepID=A0A834TCR2_9FABA|nr:uncharacterized protein G2W53_025248 [Senna tora]